MPYTIEFIDVTKKYRLGMTRTSLPALVSGLAKSALHRGRQEAAGQTHWAVREMNFALKQGESLALIGENGAGKTTILKLLAQITKPNAGKIVVNGMLSALIELGAGFHPDLSGRENIFLNGAILGLKRQEVQRRFDSIVEFAELEQFIDTPVKRYSSGMAVRLGFAVAASINPDILLVDEVLAVGDATFQLKCVQRIHELIDNGTTLIFVSHNMELARAICDMGLYIHQGQRQLFDKVDTVIETYNHALNEQRASGLALDAGIEAGGAALAVITGVEVRSLAPGEPGELYCDRPAEVLVHYRAFHNLGNVSVVLRVMRADGTSCAAIYSRLDESTISINQGEGTIRVRLDPLQLFPGMYQVIATLKNETDTLMYDMVYSRWLTVKSEIKGHLDLDAVYEPNRTWSHQPALTADTVRIANRTA